MRVEVLYVPGCPSHPAAVTLVKNILAAEGVAAAIREVLVENEEMAGKLRFCGSPTIRINGKDILAESPVAQGFALSCRWYPGTQRAGLPSASVVRLAVQQAHQEDRS